MEDNSVSRSNSVNYIFKVFLSVTPRLKNFMNFINSASSY